MTLAVLPPNRVLEPDQQTKDYRKKILDRLFVTTFEDLCHIAERFIKRESSEQHFEPIALVNETYLRLHQQHQVNWQSHRHFLVVATNTMRRILVDQARARRTNKRGGDWLRTTLDEILPSDDTGIELVMLDNAIRHLNCRDKTQAKIVKLRCIDGSTLAETAITLELSPATVKRKWSQARAWLYCEG